MLEIDLPLTGMHIPCQASIKLRGRSIFRLATAIYAALWGLAGICREAIPVESVKNVDIR
jgi:hypothetical protein